MHLHLIIPKKKLPTENQSTIHERFHPTDYSEILGGLQARLQKTDHVCMKGNESLITL